MDRRTLLVGIAGTCAVAGCLGNGETDPGNTDDSNDSNDDPNDSNDDDPDTGDGDQDPNCDSEDDDANADEEKAPTPDDATHVLSIADVDSVADEHDLEIDVDLRSRAVTPEKPAVVRVTTTNRGPARTISVEEGQCGLFDRDDGVSESGGLVLKRPGLSELADRDGDRWTKDADPDEQRAYDGYGCAGREFDACESIANEYDVWDDYRTDGYFEPGTYRFENEVAIAGAEEGNAWDDPDVTFTWGFEIDVEEA